ncbi:response regulator transcription factor [Roseateles oligotrophus]|uniref:Helix-turn-helix transcriptional regulator n=1 Tax=Roseateles oligotrophus TaxID=1769250 RepID=A0ABT2YDI9_9BURK|nr:helix-turn-helix transcriptional regulator [Roseateles oligotrophus]MCV2368102.1 helix-turn-helix transcriptional regulator [Roseateles oligotrophus]
MKYLVSEHELLALELTLESAEGEARLLALLELAWHLRQRNSQAALGLLAEMKRRLPLYPLPAETVSRLMLRAALLESEVAALGCQLLEAQACLDAARAAINPELDGLAAGDACLAEACLAKALGQRDRELLALERALAFFAGGSDPQRTGLAQGLLRCEHGVTQIRPAKPGETLADVDADAEAAGDPGYGLAQTDAATQAVHAAAQAYALCMRKPAEAAALFTRAAQLCLDMGLVRFYCILCMNASNCKLELGDLEQASQCFEAAAERARNTGWPQLMGMTQTQVGRVLRMLGRGQESLQVLNQALAQLRVAPAGLATAFACSELAFTLLEVERPLDSIEVMKEAIRLYRLWGSNVNLALTSARQARALASVGRISEALAALEEAQALVAQHGYAALTVDINEALAELHRRSKQPPPLGMTAPTATIHYAQCALTQGMDINGWKPPPALLDYLADAWADADDMAQAYSYSRMARLADQQDRALKLNDPRAMLQLLGYHRLGAAAGTQEPGEPILLAVTEPLAQQHAELLSAKEQAVLQLLARNYSNKEIAQSLGVSAETIKWRLKGLFSKLEAGSRKHAVTRARTLGMLKSGV